MHQRRWPYIKRLMSRLLICLHLLVVDCLDLHAWGQGHRLIREWAVSKLPTWQTDALGARNLHRLCNDYKSLQDQHAGGKAPHLDAYCKVPEVRLSLHDVNGPEVSAKAIRWYLDRISQNIRNGNTDEAMKFLGVLCHWNEDPGCPSAHSSPISEAELKILIPPPANKARYNYLFGYGGIADIGNYEIPDQPYQPHLLGRTRDEVALRILQHQRLLERNAAAHIVPLVQDMMQGDGAKASRHRAEAAAYNARHIADIIYSVLCLAFDRFDAKSQVWSQDLTEWLPNPTRKRTGHPYYVTGHLVDQAMDAHRKLHPLKLTGGNNKPISSGFGTGAPYSIDYALAPATSLTRFTCRVGFHVTAGEDAEVAFALVANGKELHRTKPLRPADGPVQIDVPLPSSDVLRLSLVTIPTDPSKSKSNLVLWAAPRLR